MDRLDLGMGLDMVELVMDVETEFGINLPDQRLQNVRTVGDLTDCVAASLVADHAAACPSAARFFRLRAAWSAPGLAVRRRIRPGAQVRDLIPWADRRRAWRALCQAGLRPPRLRAPAWIRWPLYVIGALGIAAVAVVSFFSPSIMSWAVLPLGFILISLAALALEPPRGIRTLA